LIIKKDDREGVAGQIAYKVKSVEKLRAIE
jgi:hypothetical protein